MGEPRIIRTLEHVGRFALNRSGVKSRYVSTPIARLHAYDAPGRGDLPTTVVLHGIGSAATPFAPVVTRLRRDARRVLAPELPGHGFSDPPRVRLTADALFDSMAKALDELVDEPAIVCGNSLGGAVALRYAIERPERVRGLVLVSPAGARLDEDEWRDLLETFAIDDARGAMRLLERLYHRTPWLAPFVAADVARVFGRRAIRDLLESVGPEDAATAEQLASLGMPVLFLWGRSERLWPESALAYFERHLPPHAIIERPEGFGHSPHLDAPARVAARIAAFSRSLGG